MPEYLSPGVYMEEFEIGARPIEGVSTSTAGFLGETERGPTTPRLITSWLQYQRVYGGYFGTDKYLPGSVEGFFKNGGSRCYIARIVKSGDTGAKSSILKLKSIDQIFIEEIDENLPEKRKKELNEEIKKEHEKVTEFKDYVLTVNAIGEGAWGNRIAVIVSTGTFIGIKLKVFYWKTPKPSEVDLKDLTSALKKQPPTISEIFDNISISETSSDNYQKVVNGISNLITISFDNNTHNAKDLSDKNFSDFYLGDGIDSGKTASIMLKSINAITELGATSFAGKILKVEATRVGAWGNSLNLMLSKIDNDNIKLGGIGSQPVGTLTIKPSDTSKVLNDLITITLDKTDDSNAIPATEGPIPLSGGTATSKASTKLKSIDTVLKATGFKDIFLKIESTEVGDWTRSLNVTLSKIDANNIKLDVSQSEFAISSTNKPLTLRDIKISIEDTNADDEKIAKAATIDSNTLKYGRGPDDPELSKLEILDYSRTDSDTPGNRKGLTAFKEIEDISIVYAPNAYDVSGLVSALIEHCESLRYRFAILDATRSSSDLSTIDPRSKTPTDHAAFYYPWIKVINPETGMLQPMPPGGYIAGIYARSDTERGVHKAPANEIVKGASDLEFQIMKGEQDTLNPRGVNVIRAFSGRGILVWGARTLSSNTLWKYINVRRLFIYIEASIEKGTQWVVFEPNDDRLWGRVKATITQFLTGVWRSGALMGTTPEEAFFVKCDRSTMTQDDIDNGRLICIIGIAPVKPAEFVIFRIAQWQGGSAATE